MGRFAEEARSHREALEAVRADFVRVGEALDPADAVLADTLERLRQAACAVEALAVPGALAAGNAGSLAALLLEAASALAVLQPAHEQLRAAMGAAAGGKLDGSSDIEGAAKGRAKDARRNTKPRAPLDFSAFTRARWEAERRKGASMLGNEDDESGVKIWMQDIPKPLPEEKPCTQVKGRHIQVNSAEKIRKVYIEMSLTGCVDRTGFIRGASVAKFNSLAIERSDCPSGKKCGGDLGWMTKGKLDSKLQDVAFVTPKAACSPPFKSMNGFHMFLCEDRKG